MGWGGGAMTTGGRGMDFYSWPSVEEVPRRLFCITVSNLLPGDKQATSAHTDFIEPRT
jgi:hypothetical protein